MINVTVGNTLTIEGLSPTQMEKLQGYLIYPKKNQCELEHTPFYQRLNKDTLLTGRGTAQAIITKLKKAKVKFKLNKTFAPSKKIQWSFHGDTREEQVDVLDRIGNAHNALIKASTGFGKTACAIQYIVKRQAQTLIVVHTTDLIKQWKQELSLFLGIPEDEIGQLGGGLTDIRANINVGTYHTISKHIKNIPHSLLICDEAHKAGAKTYQSCIHNSKAEYLLGLTATPKYQDYKKLITLLFGKVVIAMSRQELIKKKIITEAEVEIHKTGFETQSGGSYSDCLQELTDSDTRNTIILRLIERDLKRNRRGYDGAVMVLFNRTEHLMKISGRLSASGIDHRVLNGEVPAKQRTQIIKEMKAKNGPRVLLGNVSVCGTGLSIKRLDSLILAAPMRSQTSVEQFIGRVIRYDKGKVSPARIYDMIDLQPVFIGGVDSRDVLYEKLNIRRVN